MSIARPSTEPICLSGLTIFHLGHTSGHALVVESTDQFGEWFAELNDGEQVDVRALVGLLADQGPQLPFPYSSGKVPSTDACASFVSSPVAGLMGVLRF